MGLANSLQAVMRQTSFHLLTPDHVRGRAFSVFNMFSQGANAVGGAEVGFMAALLGAPGSLLFGCAVGGLLNFELLDIDAGLEKLRRQNTPFPCTAVSERRVNRREAKNSFDTGLSRADRRAVLSGLNRVSTVSLAPGSHAAPALQLANAQTPKGKPVTIDGTLTASRTSLGIGAMSPI